MEMETKNGSKIEVEEKIDLGRGLLGFDSSDRTVSRRHVSFKLNHDHDNDNDNDRVRGVSFQVKGKNPIWVRHSTTHQIRVYKSSQQGLLNLGDSFCLSSRNPLWFHLKKKHIQHDSDTKIRYDEQFADISWVDHHEFDTAHVSSIIDPVKEFDFAVMGHEFDCYSKKLVSDIRNWNWFLEEVHEDSDEENSRKKRKKGGRRKDNDDAWTGESEEDVELVKKLRIDPKPKYLTRSKDKGRKGAGAGASASVNDGSKKKVESGDYEEDDEEDDDETLGGFIVDDEDMGGDEEEEHEEDEFEEDEDDE